LWRTASIDAAHSLFLPSPTELCSFAEFSAKLAANGNTLIDRALSGDPPMLAINALSIANEKSEQRGFANLVRVISGKFTNSTAHALRIYWVIVKDDAEGFLSLVSLIHRRLDASHMSMRA
jgi:uncharacterized protein (TIGR02391 family)